jgi:hypothetical protein
MKHFTKGVRVTACVLLVILAGLLVGWATCLPLKPLLWVYGASLYVALVSLIIIWTKPFKP